MLATPREEWDRRRVGEAMLEQDQVPVFSQDEPAVTRLETLAESHLRRGLVLADGRLAGLISINDIAHALALARAHHPRPT
jgi:CBS domain-containing protein